MERLVDARGLACPQPVINTKRALEEGGAGTVITLVDNPIARDNVLKLARSLGCRAEVEEREDGFAIRIEREGAEIASSPADDKKKTVDAGTEVLVLIPTDLFGQGAEELGQVLMRMFLYTLTELKERPAGIILINGGVKLAAQGAETVPFLEALAAAGVEILVCGTCLDYYGLKERLAVGTVSNMYTIAEKLLQAQRVITIP
ncbi:MAG: sulfurtransferase-like selenium metabolism protein YedF [bacterium]|jgi:selenium metabolism protein YedF|nr:sulfurtransferase-like selenium metabolism protein YedF [Bacillota bacterium]HHW55824.1 sulfurtransferase-like selenium metabolism protein YedF [Bacillota bacterium]